MSEKLYIERAKEIARCVVELVLEVPEKSGIVFAFDRNYVENVTEFMNNLRRLAIDYTKILKKPFKLELFEIVNQYNWDMIMDLIWLGIVELLNQSEKGKEIFSKIYD
jgi:hypothetical protein